MPRRELKYPHQVETWLLEMGHHVTQAGQLILIGSGALLWHASQRGLDELLPENSMDVVPITDSDEIASLCYQAIIGSDFERSHGWHANLMPELVLREFPSDWESRASARNYGQMRLLVPAPADLLVPKIRRGEARDHAHAAWAMRVGLL